MKMNFLEASELSRNLNHRVNHSAFPLARCTYMALISRSPSLELTVKLKLALFPRKITSHERKLGEVLWEMLGSSKDITKTALGL